MKRIYVCEDQATGIFSAVYDAWLGVVAEGVGDWGIRFRGCMDQELFCDYVEVRECQEKVSAVERLILRHLGWYAYKMIYQAALASDTDKGDAILGTMLAARKIPDSRRIMDHLGEPWVRKLFELSRAVGEEAHRWMGFLRFRELENGVMYGKFRPKHRVLTCVAPHFADRFPEENWMIYDEVHGEYGVHEAGRQWVLVSGEETDPEKTAAVSEEEGRYQDLWRQFTGSISIAERRNPGRQQNFLPIRCRRDMTEFV